MNGRLSTFSTWRFTIAPTGSVPRKRDTEYLPLTPDEIADTAYLCEQEGASIIHVHCRDENENPTSDYQTFKETVDKIRKHTRLIVMVSTSGIAGTSNEERAEPLKTNPEMASLTTGSL
ncbi:MAG: 3-keto-5-aminohexanoate cleavage protein, partial [Candidatus Thorarchaeota archaeon]